MSDQYIHAKSLALYTGSPSLIGFINYLRNLEVSEEIFRFFRRMIKQSFPVDDTCELENKMNVCITRRNYFYEVKKNIFKLLNEFSHLAALRLVKLFFK